MYTLESLPLIHVWLDADQLASTARIIMDGYRVPSIGIVNSNHELIGMVSSIELAGAPKDANVGRLMVQPAGTLDSAMTVREAAGEFVRLECDFLPVLKGRKFLAMVTARDLLGRLRESFDPMTDLPWSDALRDWGTEKLEHDVEIAVLFIDLNHFGVFNKEYGHVVGDRVIKEVANHLKKKIDRSTDVLVRYGGDEFAIGTVRTREEAEALMTSILGDQDGLRVDGVDTPVTFTVGIHGGLRSKGRRDVHGASNLDNLVNLASRDCLARKIRRDQAVVDAPAETADLVEHSVEVTETAAPTATATATRQETEVDRDVRTVGVMNAVIETIQADDEPGSLTYVVVKAEGKLAVGVSPKMGSSRSESIAIATGKALEKAYPDTKVTIDSVTVERAGSTELVTARVRTVREGLERDVTAQAEANGDLDETIGLVVISAFLAE